MQLGVDVRAGAAALGSRRAGERRQVAAPGVAQASAAGDATTSTRSAVTLPRA